MARMVGLLLGATLLCAVTCLEHEPIRCDQGHWETVLSLDELPTGGQHFARNVYSPDQPQRSQTAWLHEACPAQCILSSCYMNSGHPNNTLEAGRPRKIETRYFVPNDKRCEQFFPLEFLEVLRNRKIVFVGDSVMNQIWGALLCALSHATHIDIHHDWRSKYMSAVSSVNYCPFDEKHCHALGGTARVPSTNTTLDCLGAGTVGDVDFIRTVRERSLGPNDIIVFNVGLHLHDRGSYVHNIDSALRQVLHMNRSVASPHIIFSETTPQHFATATSEYDTEVAKTMQRCGLPPPMPQTAAEWVERMRPLDWRNALLKERVHRYNSAAGSVRDRVGYVSIAEALYSQHDAHVDMTHIGYLNYPDCTHFCTPSGALRFVHSAIYNALLDKLGERRTAGPAKRA